MLSLKNMPGESGVGDQANRAESQRPLEPLPGLTPQQQWNLERANDASLAKAASRINKSVAMVRGLPPEAGRTYEPPTREPVTMEQIANLPTPEPQPSEDESTSEEVQLPTDTSEWAQEGWMTQNAVAGFVGRSWKKFGELIDQDLAAHPERRQWTGEYTNTRGTSRYLAPEYVELLAQELMRPAMVEPEGYSTVGWRALQEATGFAGMETMQRQAELLAENNQRPDWIMPRFWDGQRFVTRYADELRDLLIQEAQRRRELPLATPDLVTFEDMRANVTSRDWPAFRTWLNEYVEIHPDDDQVRQMRNEQGGSAIYVTPARRANLINQFKQELRAGTPLPEDHILVSQLSNEVCALFPGLNPKSVSVAIRRWLGSHPDIPPLGQYRYDVERKPAAGMPRNLADRILADLSQQYGGTEQSGRE